MQIQIKDGALLKVDPQSLISYVAVPLKDWFRDTAYS
jgi:hypothetical protein